MPAVPGRNDPCPCGSGRKYKHCCLARSDVDDQRRLRVRRAEGRVVDALMTYVLQQFGKPFFEEAWLDFWAGEPPQDAEEFTDVPEFEAMFIPWFVTQFVRDPHGEVIEPHWPGVPVGLHWLATSSAEVSELDLEWLIAACASPMSLFVVEAVDPGRSIDLRDLFTGREFHVLEQRASQGLEPKHLYFARVVTAGGISLLFGAAPYICPPSYHLEALDWRDGVFRRRKPTVNDLREFDIEIRDLYHAFADRLLNPTPPRLTNTDGDDLEPTTLEYELRVSVADAFEHLLPLATIGDDKHVSDVVEDGDGVMSGAVLNWVKGGNRKMKQWDNTILGTLRLEVGRLIADVNSKRRADRLAREIKKRLGADATLRARTVQNMAQMLAERQGRAGRGETAVSMPEDDRPPEFDALEDDMYRQHLHAWIDMRVPALGNRTPRQLSKTPRGRERLEALLAGIQEGPGADRPARHEARAAMRRELGLDE